MTVSRRQWLMMAAGMAGAGFLPLRHAGLSAAAIAAPAGTPVPASPSLHLVLSASALDPALRRGIESVAGTGVRVQSLILPALGHEKAPRLDELVEQLRPWRGHTLLGSVAAHQNMWFDEALRVLGAAVLSRGEHTLQADGRSRHHLMSASGHSEHMEVQRSTGWSDAPVHAWAMVLGADLAACALKQGASTPQLPLADLQNLPPPIDAHLAAGVPTRSRHFISFVTRI